VDPGACGNQLLGKSAGKKSRAKILLAQPLSYFLISHRLSLDCSKFIGALAEDFPAGVWRFSSWADFASVHRVMRDLE